MTEGIIERTKNVLNLSTVENIGEPLEKGRECGLDATFIRLCQIYQMRRRGVRR